MAMSIGKTDYTAGMQNQYMKSAQNTASKALGAIAAERALSGVDSANLQIADALRMEASGNLQGIANANDAIGIAQIADGVLEGLNDAAIRMNELNVRAMNGVSLDANGNIDPSELGKDYQRAITSEATALKNSMQESINDATYNGKNIFSGIMNFETTAGNFGINLAAPNIDSIDVRNSQSIKNFMDSVNRVRSDVGSFQNGLMSNIESVSAKLINTTASESQLQNNDIAKNINNFNSANMRLNASSIAQAHNLTSLQNQIATLLA